MDTTNNAARTFRLTADLLKKAADYGINRRYRHCDEGEVFSILCRDGVITHPDADDMTDAQWRKFCKAVRTYR